MFYKTIDFSKYSSIKIGQPTEVLMIEKGDTIPPGRFLVGGANNLLVSPNPPPLMMLSKDFAFIEEDKDMLVIGAAMPTGRIVSYCKRNDIGNFEFCAKLPGTLGGMLAMNAGVKSYEIFNILHSIEIDGKWILKEDIPHGYRYARLGGTATAAKFPLHKGFSQHLLDELLALRNNQPHEPSAGSAFKNPPNDYAGRLIEAVGLKGLRKGGMQWSEIHANFLVNTGNATYEDAIYLLDLAKERVNAQFGITLQEEIKLL
ncbi:UDP-N-acetylenolpyruvoylglucosamine reductase [Sulfurovum lithotrophicum]|uniref:UDP-N-acetylenolpyruvoylglucosamine reductase n=1 Tax=Sulfurovum lithotrophicum TaxID=206403 RepID=A0A7U4M2M1_9BACT|nr:UDP-N-acetylmuramate dehydrogenase [Sulfurovum lithotrophicum]AKF25727.1 UDP-N-acetylenolpyruvoylglucosamine reductase [Sulfurovum lithotrophicum]